MQTKELRNLILAALFVAIDIALTRALGLVLQPAPLVRYSVQFLCYAMTGWLTAPGWAVAGAVTGDMVGVMINPMGGGVPLPWVTAVSAASGLTYALFLCQRKPSFWRCLIPVIIDQMVFSLFVYAYFGKYMGGAASFSVNLLHTLPFRAAAVFPYAIVIFGTQKALERPVGRLLR